MRQVTIGTILLLIVSSTHLYAGLKGQALIDSMLKKLPTAKEDTNKVLLLEDLAYECYQFNMPGKAISYGNQQMTLATKLAWEMGIAKSNNILGMSYLGKGEPKKGLAYFKDALKMYEHMGRNDKAGVVALNMGNVYLNIQDNAQAISYYYKSLKICEKAGMCEVIANCYTGLAIVYGTGKDFATAVEYHTKALKTAESCPRSDTVQLVRTYSNLAVSYQNKGDCASSLPYSFKALKLAQQIGALDDAANMYGNISLSYTKLRDYEKAVYYGRRALAYSDSVRDKKHVAWSLYELGNAYLSFITDTTTAAESRKLSIGNMGPASKPAQTRVALDYLERGLDSIHGIMYEEELTVKIYEDLSKAYRLTGQWEKALNAHDRFIGIRDSVFTKETGMQLTTHQMNYDFDKKEAATRAQQEKKDIQQRNIRNSTLAGMAGLLIFSLVVIRQRNRVKKEKANVEVEKGRSDALLLNILPHEVAEELKTKGTTTAKHYDNVTVLFTDFVNFTQAAEQMNAQGLIDELHACFKMFDEITAKYNIEKIKTIGDAYLAVCGLPTPDPKHAENVVKAAAEINTFMADRLAKMGSERTFAIRIGIHSGSVVAGIVGVKKFAYDIWGDTVNTAARMEQNSEAGKINISQTTYELVKDKFPCEYRGEVEAKGKGVMKMYFVAPAGAPL